VQGAEEKVKKGYASPNNLEEANKLVSDCKVNNVDRHIIVWLMHVLCQVMARLKLRLNIQEGKEMFGEVTTEVKYSGEVW